MIKPTLKVIQGDLVDTEFPITKPEGTPPGEDWLRALPKETRFVCHHKADKGSFLDYYGIAAILPKVVMLYDFNTPMGNPFKFVISERFSRDRKLIEILPSMEDEDGVQRNSPVAEPRPDDDGHEGSAADLPEE